MDELKQQIAIILQQNAGNRLTTELIGGIVARINLITRDQELKAESLNTILSDVKEAE